MITVRSPIAVFSNFATRSYVTVFSLSTTRSSPAVLLSARTSIFARRYFLRSSSHSLTLIYSLIAIHFPYAILSTYAVRLFMTVFTASSTRSVYSFSVLGVFYLALLILLTRYSTLARFNSFTSIGTLGPTTIHTSLMV
jgi:hypothetical protein